MLDCLAPMVRASQDLFQFASQPRFGVDDADELLQQSLLDDGGGFVRITLFDFSSAFNTSQPLIPGFEAAGDGVWFFYCLPTT